MKCDLLDIYSDFLITQCHQATATTLSKILKGVISHDKITRFLNKNAFDSKDLWSYVKPSVRRYEQEDGVLIVDDTIEEKPYTDENLIVAWHFSHAKNRCVKGINLLSCLVRYDTIALPISFSVIDKDLFFSNLKTKKTHRHASLSKNDRFRSMFDQAIHNEVQFEYVLADSWFGSKANMQHIHNQNKRFIFGLKSNRVVALSEEEAKKGQYRDLNSVEIKNGEAKKIWLRGVFAPLTLIKKTFKNEGGSVGTLYLVTNDLDSDADRIYQIYQKRWSIEVYHKSIKQNSSLEKSPTKVVRSQMNHLFASLIGYCKLELLKLEAHLNPFKLKFQLLLKANQAAYEQLRKIKTQCFKGKKKAEKETRRSYAA